MRTTSTLIGAAALILAVAACGAPSEQNSEASEDGQGPLRVGVSPVPHGDILAFIEENLAEEAGLELDIVEIADYNTPNAQLVEGDLDANYFQHRSFLNEWVENGPDADLNYVTDVHIERLGLYSETVDGLDDLPDGAEIAVPNDPANLNRALGILEAEGLITVDPEAGETATENDITDNPNDLTVLPLEAAQLPRSVSDVDAAVVNGNYAIEADLTEESNLLAWEPEGDDYVQKYANGLVALEENVDDERVQLLAELLHDEQVLEYIQETWQGVVLAVDADGQPVE
ncbi:MetQ/NlpA family ABC transporter substrate-binding protein [Nocardiopsis sp. MG754419]|uniref:MetQ/NlpA family ABC transporter substrate-binding protein n=1 Tax=Nocardiopsis sp. MG754419 TaxID=2259865 RepID=UPI001BA57A93|nr:MetQ/NlpA family ABC transporter substrate-binding protein [Nocardiopsis sp. MG754419]MBR8740202.1 metal ABC transporter substrate-binding protein [Nocardiopsis sp. MG754419]